MTEQSLVDAPSDAPVDPNTRLLRALPAPVFTLVYGAVVIGLIAGGIVLAETAGSAERAPADVGKPLRPFFPPPADATNVQASVRPYLIADAASTPTITGVALTGTMTDTAEADVSEFAGHVSRLLKQNCVDNMTVRSQDNLRLNLWGYCFNSPGADVIEEYTQAALNRDADVVTFSFFPGKHVEHYASLAWFADADEGAEAAIDNWEGLAPVGSTQHLELMALSPEKARLKNLFSSDVGAKDEYVEVPPLQKAPK